MTTIVQPATPDPEIASAAINACAVASLAYQLELERFRYVVTLAHRHGAATGAVAAAAGLTCEQVATLINQGEL